MFSYFLNIWSIFSMSSKLVKVQFISSMKEPVFWFYDPICIPVIFLFRVLLRGLIFIMYGGPLARSPCLKKGS